MGKNFRDIDKGYKASMKRWSALGGVLQVGIPDDGTMHSGGGISLVALGILHEFGQGDIPERSWLRSWFDANQSFIKSSLFTMVRAVAAGTLTKEEAINKLGKVWVGQVEEGITNRIPPPNLPATLAAKARLGQGSTPLIAEGEMYSAITYLYALAENATPQPAKKGPKHSVGRRRQ